MSSKYASVDEYLDSLEEPRKSAITTVLDVIRANIDPTFEEGIQYNMIGWYVPFSIYPDGYHCDPKQPVPCLHLGAQKSHMAIYAFCIYGSPEAKAEFFADYEASGKKLDAGSSCIRFKKLEDLPLDVIARMVSKVKLSDFLETYISSIPPSKRKKSKA